MKKCPWCDKEYPDSAVECSIDREPLTGGAPPVLTRFEELVVTATLAPLAPAESVVVSPSPPAAWTDWRVGSFEVVLVIVVAFGSSILYSTLLFLGVRSGDPGAGMTRWLNSGLHEAAALGLLWYVLMRRSRSFGDLGLKWARKDVGRSVRLWMLGTLAVYGVYREPKTRNTAEFAGGAATSASGPGFMSRTRQYPHGDRPRPAPLLW